FVPFALRAATPAAEVFSLEGKGEHREAQQSNWKPVVVKQNLFPTNYVRTLEKSRMAILLADRTQIRLTQNTQMQIKEVATPAGGNTTIDLKQGRAWAQSKNPPRSLTMETPAAIAAIRGTDWEMVVEEDGRSTLSVFSGEVELYND